MKKFFTLCAAGVCAIGCAVGLIGCGEEETGGKNVGGIYITDGVNNDYNGNVNYNIQSTYGQSVDLDGYKVLVHYSDNSYGELNRTDPKLSVAYSYLKDYAPERESIAALPQKMLTGTYYIEYTYDGNSSYKAEVSISVSPADGGNFTVRTGKSNWYYNESAPAVTLVNPSGATVEEQAEGEALSADDVNYSGTDVNRFIAVDKERYDALTAEQKSDYDYMSDFIFGSGNENNYFFYSGGQKYALPVGEYMVFAFIGRTYNYIDIVTAAVPITVKEFFVGRKLYFQSIVLQDASGNTLTDENDANYGEYVTGTAQVGAANAGKYVVCNSEHYVRGTVNFGDGVFDDLTAAQAYVYTFNYVEFSSIGTLDIMADGTVGDDSVGGTLVASGSYDGRTNELVVDMPVPGSNDALHWIVTFVAQ